MHLESSNGNLSVALPPYRSSAVTNTIAIDYNRIFAFSNAIASASEQHVLANVLKHQLRQLFDIDDYAIYAISENRQVYYPILYHGDGYFSKNLDCRLRVDPKTDMNKSLADQIMRSPGPVRLCADEWFYFNKFTKAQRAAGDKNLMAVAIRFGEENIAIMCYRQDQCNQTAIQRHLFRSICSQIAITIANLKNINKLKKILSETSNDKEQLEQEKTYLREEIATTQNYSEIVGSSPEMLQIFQLIESVAPSSSTVLLLGETGTGKELIARAIHNASSRKDKLMVKVNCAALPANLIESELFGHERGSFTGATDRRIGKFELAHGGTIFLDEIGEMALDMQVKLLRVLQEREIERVGGKDTIKVDVRIIAATNRNLETEMRAGRFRSDLYYRLNVFPIVLPPLRERKDDIPGLATYFINHFANKSGKKINPLSRGAMTELIKYSWPGNIRELEHFIERCVLLTPGDTIKQIDLPASNQGSAADTKSRQFILKTIHENERDHILNMITYCKGRIAGKDGAARLLAIPPSTLNSKMKKLGIKKEHSA